MPFEAVRVVEGYAALTMTDANCPDAVVTENVALLPLDVQPAKKRIATSAEIPMARHTTPLRLKRMSLNIRAILVWAGGSSEQTVGDCTRAR